MDILRFVRHPDIKFIGYGMLGELCPYYWITFVARHVINRKVFVNLAVNRIGYDWDRCHSGSRLANSEVFVIWKCHQQGIRNERKNYLKYLMWCHLFTFPSNKEPGSDWESYTNVDEIGLVSDLHKATHPLNVCFSEWSWLSVFPGFFPVPISTMCSSRIWQMFLWDVWQRLMLWYR